MGLANRGVRRTRLQRERMRSAQQARREREQIDGDLVRWQLERAIRGAQRA